MSKKIVAVLALAVSAISAVGCSGGPDLQARIDELTREQEDLQRQKELTESELLAMKARCEALERNRSSARVTPAPAAPVVTPVPADSEGMDIRKRGNDTVINLPSDVFFASGSSTLSAAGEKTMAKIGAYIRKNHAGGLIRVEGHSDSDPIKKTKGKYHCNYELSFERAHAVVHYLVEKGHVDSHRFVCEAYADNQPQSQNDKSKNRRVEIVIGKN
jgi:flagellar motor protein MotB